MVSEHNLNTAWFLLSVLHTYVTIGIGGESGWGVTGPVVQKTMEEMAQLMDSTLTRLSKEQAKMKKEALAKVIRSCLSCKFDCSVLILCIRFFYVGTRCSFCKEGKINKKYEGQVTTIRYYVVVLLLHVYFAFCFVYQLY